MARFTENRWTSAIIPALLIHIPIGTVYCWSVFKQLIADRLHASPASVEWGFSLAIFFLGMSAAFAGPMVEKNIKKSALVSMVCFVVGFAGTGVSIALNFLPGVFICYGAIMGIGLGVGYLTPVKNLMLWFADNKGLATGIAVAGFGLAQGHCQPTDGISHRHGWPGQHVLHPRRGLRGDDVRRLPAHQASGRLGV
jgi:OFA family oxalate/formate antiporter-like MFS transporter